MYCTVLCLALLPILISFSTGKYPCYSLLVCPDILLRLAFLFGTFFFYYVHSVFGIFCALFLLFVYSCLFPTFVQVYRPLLLGGNKIIVNKYHVT